MDNFNLSEKRCTNFREDFIGKKDENAWYLERDVKEFIRLLKNKLCVEHRETIDKLAGEKLI